MSNGEPPTGVSAPPDPTENTDTEWLKLAVASSPPLGLNATEYGDPLPPVANGEPLICVSVPPDPTENTDTVFVSLAAASSPRSG